MKLHSKKHQLSYNKCTFNALRTDENFVNLFVLLTGKEEKEVKSSL